MSQMGAFARGRGCPESDIEGFFQSIDTNHDGVIQFSEFWTMMRIMHGAPEAPAPCYSLSPEEAAAQRLKHLWGEVAGSGPEGNHTRLTPRCRMQAFWSVQLTHVCLGSI